MRRGEMGSRVRKGKRKREMVTEVRKMRDFDFSRLED